MAGKIDIITFSEDDKYLTLNPEKTYFHKKVSKHSNFSIQYVDLDSNKENIDFGSKVRFKVPQNIGHLLKGITFKIKADDIPDEWNLYYQDGSGVGIIEYADLIIGGTIIERIDSNYITIEKTYFNNLRHQENVEQMTGLIPQTTFSNWYGCKKTFSQKSSQKKFDFQVELPFYFYKNLELSLPICSLTKQEVEIEIKFREIKDLLFSKTSDLYGEECVDFPFPTYYNGNWIRKSDILFLEMIKGWDRTQFSYHKYNKVAWYENSGTNMLNAQLGKNGLGIHRHYKKYVTRDYYPYSSTYEEPSWSIIDFMNHNGGKTYDIIILGNHDWNLQDFTYTDTIKTLFHSYKGLLGSGVDMRIISGYKEYSKNATLSNPYQSIYTLRNDTYNYPHTTTYGAFVIEKTGPNILKTVYNNQLENVYGNPNTPFRDINKQNEEALPINWKNHGKIGASVFIGEARAVTNAPQTFQNFSLGAVYTQQVVEPVIITQAQINSHPLVSDSNEHLYPITQNSAGFVRIFSHTPIGGGTIPSNKLEKLENGDTIISDVQSKGMLELHFPMHDYIQQYNFPDAPKYIGVINEPLLSGVANFPISSSQFTSINQGYGFGNLTRITSAGKAIVSSIGDPSFPYDLRIFTWYPNKTNGFNFTPGYTYGGENFVKTDEINDRYRIVFPNSRIYLDSPSRGSKTTHSKSDLQMSDYWETFDYENSFLQGRTSTQDNGHFALFWGHVRNITIAYSYVLDSSSNNNFGAVRIYQWDFHNWNTYIEYTQDWEKNFILLETINPPDTPTYNFNFGEKISMSRTSEMIIVSEPNWVPVERQTMDKSENTAWNVGRVHVYKRDTSVRRNIETTIVTVSGGVFFVGNVQQPTLEFYDKQTYVFDLSDQSNNGHELRFSETIDGVHNSGSTYTNGVNLTGTPGTPGSKLTIIIDSNTPATLYYYCAFHPMMGGVINVLPDRGRYILKQTIYPELPSFIDRLKRSRALLHPIYTSWNDPIQKKWEFGKTLDLSDDDKTLIIGADSDISQGPNESPNGTSGGWVSIYQLNEDGIFEFKHIISQKLGGETSTGFGSDSISVTSSGNDIAVSNSDADWNPETELPFPDTSFDPVNVPQIPISNENCGNIQLFSKDTKTPRNYENVNINIKECKLKLEVVYVDKQEENSLINRPITQIITQLQRNTFDWHEYEGDYYDDDYVQPSQKNKFKLNFCNPVKEMFFLTKKNNTHALTILNDSNTNTDDLCFFQGITDFDGYVRNYGNRETNNVFTSTKFPQPVMESIKSLSLRLDEKEVISTECIGEYPSHFLRSIPASKYHTHTSSNRRLYLWSFSLQPENWKPSGHVNFSDINSQILTIEGYKTGWKHKHDFFVYAKSFNVMQIKNGSAKLMYPLFANGISTNLGNVNDYPVLIDGAVLNGDNPLTHERGEIYVDPGISVSPDLTFSTTNRVNENVSGTYDVTYALVNEHGNVKRGNTIQRIVNVVDTIAPVLILQGDAIIRVIQNYNGSLGIPSPPVLITPPDENLPYEENSNFDVSQTGEYTITYSATDLDQNVGTVTRNIIVYASSIQPSFTLIGGNQNLTECDVYTDPGYENFDEETSSVPTYSSTVNTSQPGSYTASWTSTSLILGSSQQLTLTRNVTINAISFTPPKSIEAFCLYEPIVDESGYDNHSLLIDDSVQSPVTYTLFGTNYNITQITRDYKPTCNNNTRASRTINWFGEPLIDSYPTGSISQYNGALPALSSSSNGLERVTFVYHTTLQSSYGGSTQPSYGNIFTLGTSKGEIYGEIVSGSNPPRVKVGWRTDITAPLGSQIMEKSVTINMPSYVDKVIFVVSGYMLRFGSSYFGYIQHNLSLNVRAYLVNTNNYSLANNAQSGSNVTLYANYNTSATSSYPYNNQNASYDLRLVGSSNSSSYQLQLQQGGYNMSPWQPSDGQSAYIIGLDRELYEN